MERSSRRLLRVNDRRWLFCAMLVPILGAHARVQSPALDKQLFVAAGKGNVAAVADLLARGADVNTSNSYGVTPLFMAADKANVELVKLLLRHGADPNIKELQWGKTPLGVASVPWSDVKAEDARAEIVNLLIDRGAGMDGAALVDLIRARHFEAARTIIGRGGAGASYLNLALGAAKRAQQTDLIELLIKAGAAEPGPLDSTRSPERLSTLTGVYRNRSGDALTLKPGLHEDQLLLERAQAAKVALFPVELTILKSEDLKVVVTFKPGPLPPTEITIRDDGRSEVFTRVATKPER